MTLSMALHCVIKTEKRMMSLVLLQLPDGTEIQVGPDRFKVPEVLFNPVCCVVTLTNLPYTSHLRRHTFAIFA